MVNRPCAIANSRPRISDRLQGPQTGFCSGIGPLGAAVDPGAQECDLSSREARTSRRHELAADAGGHSDQTAVAAVAGLDGAHGSLPVVKAQAFHLDLRSVTDITALLEDGLNVAAEIGRGLGAGWCYQTYDTIEDEQNRRISSLYSVYASRIAPPGCGC